MTRREPPSFKAITGVIVLVVVSVVCVVAGVRTVQSMANPSQHSKLERFSAGAAPPAVATLGDPSARMAIGLPSRPSTLQHEAFIYLGQVNSLARATSVAGSASVDVLWFHVLPDFARDTRGLLTTLAAAEATKLGGTLVAHRVGTRPVAAYNFEVHPITPDANGDTYCVRVLVRGDVVYFVRVKAPSGGAEALTKVVDSIKWSRRHV